MHPIHPLIHDWNRASDQGPRAVMLDDETLRDGLQSPSVRCPSIEQKLHILHLIDRLGIDTSEVLQAAGTKWNFLPFRPGLVGGHCIGVDPYYLTHKAEMVGYHPEVILAGRRINDGMGKFVADQTVKHLVRNGWQVKDAPIVVLGLTFKEDCPDLRNSRVIDVIRELQSYGAAVHVHDRQRLESSGHLQQVNTTRSRGRGFSIPRAWSRGGRIVR